MNGITTFSPEIIPLQVSFTGQGKAASDSWANEFQQYGWADVKLTAAVFNTAAHATQVSSEMSRSRWRKSMKTERIPDGMGEIDEDRMWNDTVPEWKQCHRCLPVQRPVSSSSLFFLFFIHSPFSTYCIRFLDNNRHFQGQHAQPERLPTQGLILLGCLDLHSTIPINWVWLSISFDYHTWHKCGNIQIKLCFGLSFLPFHGLIRFIENSIQSLICLLVS